MPVDYSKWDALELSDDSDIEVHPNVDKRSFIRAKQNQIHLERDARKHEIKTLRYHRLVNDGVATRITGLLASLRAREADTATRSPGEVAFVALMESQGKLDDSLPPAPEGVRKEELFGESPTYARMMASLLDQVNKALDEKKPERRYPAMVAEIEEHLGKVREAQLDVDRRLEALEKEEHKKITSEDYRTGFDSSQVARAKPEDKKEEEARAVELLNPGYAGGASGGEPREKASKASDDEEIEASPAAKKFAGIKAGDYRESAAFLSSNPQILAERETDGILILAFDAALEKKDDLSRQCVHQALLIQYCRALGRDGVGLFFKRITTKGHQAQEVFYKDVQDTYMRIKNRAGEIRREREAEAAAGGSGGVEQIQLHAVDEGTVINIQVPEVVGEDEQGEEADQRRRQREIFEGFKPEMRAALETGSLDKVNKVLGDMPVDEAEELVGLFGEANVLSLEEQIIDATTEEGRQALKEMEQQRAQERKEQEAQEKELAPDPE